MGGTYTETWDYTLEFQFNEHRDVVAVISHKTYGKRVEIKFHSFRDLASAVCEQGYLPLKLKPTSCSAIHRNDKMQANLHVAFVDCFKILLRRGHPETLDSK